MLCVIFLIKLSILKFTQKYRHYFLEASGKTGGGMSGEGVMNELGG